VVPLGVPRKMLLRLRSAGRASVHLQVHDGHPEPWSISGMPRTVSLRPGKELEVPYELTPTQRGEAYFSGCQLRMFSPLRLWWQKRHVAASQRVRVYPNFAPLAKLALIGAEQASRIMGAHLKRRRGEGTEFQQLREYRAGDSMRQIDWKASQRVRKLISRDYQEERNQQLMLILDTGRRMLAKDGGDAALSHFDHTLNAALMVAHIALRQGDAVGLLCAGEKSRFVPPARGLGAMDGLLNAVFDLQPQALATDYLKLATEFYTRQRRRALVVLVSNVRDEDIEDLLIAVRQLRRHHLVCVASLREQVLEDTLAKIPQNLDAAITGAAVAHYVELRAKAHDALKAHGVEVLDVNCAQLPAALVNHYLAIKRSGRL
jgi:uncharacterized protein (DUF58 family)